LNGLFDIFFYLYLPAPKVKFESEIKIKKLGFQGTAAIKALSPERSFFPWLLPVLGFLQQGSFALSTGKQRHSAVI
jgi:hypothetical protein